MGDIIAKGREKYEHPLECSSRCLYDLVVSHTMEQLVNTLGEICDTQMKIMTLGQLAY